MLECGMPVTREPSDVVEVRHLLSEWDPLGFYAANGTFAEEYEGLIKPLLTRLGHGADVDQLVAYLDHELHQHFGTFPDETTVIEFAERVLKWWAARPV
jgi:hypothetical protein